MLEKDTAFLKEKLPFFGELAPDEQKFLLAQTRCLRVEAGTLVHASDDECLGVILLKEGQLRAFLLSEGGREITLYSIGAGDLSMLAASCILQNAALPISVDAETDACFYVIPPHVYNTLRASSPAVERYTSEVLGTSFSVTMRAMEQAFFMPLEGRLAMLLLQRSAFEQSPRIHLTQEELARHLGTAREVVTRILKQFGEEGLISVFRGGVEILSVKKLQALSSTEDL